MFFHFDIGLKDLLYLLGVVVSAAIGAFALWKSNVRQVNSSTQSTRDLIEHQRQDRAVQAKYEEYVKWSVTFRESTIEYLKKIDECFHNFTQLHMHTIAYKNIQSKEAEEIMNSLYEKLGISSFEFVHAANTVRTLYSDRDTVFNDFDKLSRDAKKIVSDFNAKVRSENITIKDISDLNSEFLRSWNQKKSEIAEELIKILEAKRQDALK